MKIDCLMLVAAVYALPSNALALQPNLNLSGAKVGGVLISPARAEPRIGPAAETDGVRSVEQRIFDLRNESEGHEELAQSQMDDRHPPSLSVEELERSKNHAAEQRGAQPVAGTSASGEIRLTVARLDDYVVTGGDGSRLGEVEGVALVDGQLYAIIEFGGVWGFGKDRAAIPFSELFVDDRETLVAPNMREQGLEVLADDISDRYASLPRDHEFTLPRL